MLKLRVMALAFSNSVTDGRVANELSTDNVTGLPATRKTSTAVSRVPRGVLRADSRISAATAAYGRAMMVTLRCVPRMRMSCDAATV